MKKALLICLMFGSLALGEPSYSGTRTKITGNSDHQVKENAFRAGMHYPVGPMKCSQRCSQWWEKSDE